MTCFGGPSPARLEEAIASLAEPQVTTRTDTDPDRGVYAFEWQRGLVRGRVVTWDETLVWVDGHKSASGVLRWPVQGEAAPSTLIADALRIASARAEAAYEADMSLDDIPDIPE